MKKLLSMALVVILCFSLFACGELTDVLNGIDKDSSNKTQTTRYTYDDDYDDDYDDNYDDNYDDDYDDDDYYDDDNNYYDETTTTTKAETTVTTKEDITTSKKTTTTKTTTTTVKPTTQAASKLTQREALNIAKSLVEKENTYEVYGTCCEFEPVDEDERQEIISRASLTSAQKEIIEYASISECECCDSYRQAMNHTNKYIDSSWTKQNEKYYKDYYIEYDGDLYFAIPGAGFMGYGDVTVKSFDDNCIIAHAGMFGDVADSSDVVVFTIKNIGGTYKITNVEW